VTSPSLIPVPFVVTRYRCPVNGCGRTRSSKRAITEHIGRCWWNPAAKSCKTCEHYYPGDNGCGENGGCSCASGEFCRADAADLGDPKVGLPVGCPAWEEVVES